MRPLARLALVLLPCTACSLFSSMMGPDPQGPPANNAGQASAGVDPEAERRRLETELAAKDREIAMKLDRSRAAAETGEDPQSVHDYAALVAEAHAVGSVERGKVDGPAHVESALAAVQAAEAAHPDEASAWAMDRSVLLAASGDVATAATTLRDAIVAKPDLAAFELLLALPAGPPVDALALEACHVMRPEIVPAIQFAYVDACLARAGGDRGQLKWKGAKKDLKAYDQELARLAEEERKRAEEEARRKAEEEARQAEEAARLAEAAAQQDLAIAASVFAAGTCEFGDCARKGWTMRTDAGDIRVSCEFGDCLQKGWSARFPDGSTARTSCNFGNCMEKGWDTRLPDGSTARTSCNFGECATKGWDTRLPDGSTARTSCNFGECYTKGWETRLPSGGSVRCSCSFGDCLQKGTECR